jgi:hypothetical protein
MVSTARPLVAAGPNDPKLRDGVWLSDPHADCRFDSARPVRRWPHCADAMIVREGRLHAPGGHKPSDTAVYALSAGAPILGQAEVISDDGRGFYYEGVEPTAFDAQGRITAFRAWPVVCGPSGKDGKPSGTFPGLVRPAGKPGSGCTTDSLETVRRAAISSRGLGDLNPARWVRDGDR